MTLMTSSTVLKVILLKKLNELNGIKKVKINGKRLIESQKKLLSLFDNLLKTIFNKTDNENKTVNKNKSKSDNKTDNKNNSSTKNKAANESKNDNDSDNNSDNYSDSENENQGKNKNKTDGYYYKIKQLNNWFKKIVQTTSLEVQMKTLKKKFF